MKSFYSSTFWKIAETRKTASLNVKLLVILCNYFLLIPFQFQLHWTSFLPIFLHNWQYQRKFSRTQKTWLIDCNCWGTCFVPYTPECIAARVGQLNKGAHYPILLTVVLKLTISPFAIVVAVTMTTTIIELHTTSCFLIKVPTLFNLDIGFPVHFWLPQTIADVSCDLRDCKKINGTTSF